MDLARELIAHGIFKVKRICDVLGVSRSNQYEHSKPRPKRYKKGEDTIVLKSILEVTKERSTYGYPRVTALINRKRKQEFLPVWNEKRVFRVMQMNSLVLPKYTIKPKRPHLGQVITMKSNTRYCSDILEIKCWSGERLYIAFSLDCHDREAMN